jgi:hypothetical protein
MAPAVENPVDVVVGWRREGRVHRNPRRLSRRCPREGAPTLSWQQYPGSRTASFNYDGSMICCRSSETSTMPRTR